MARLSFKEFAASTAVEMRSVFAGIFHGADDLDRLEPKNVEAEVTVDATSRRPDRSQYEQMLERELDRQILSVVEQEDIDMIDRVRSALYSAD